MKACLTGFEKTGKTTLFKAITGIDVPINLGQTPENMIHEGVAIVEDQRITKLSAMFNPRKTTYATIKYVDLPGISKNDQQRNQKIFENIKDAEVLIHVIRAFNDSATIHPFGEIDIERDIKSFESELLLFDYLLVEKRIERITNNLKRGLKENQKELELFQKMKEYLENEKPLRTFSFSPEEAKILLPYKFISIKPIIHVINHGEEGLEQLQNRVNFLSNSFNDSNNSSIISLCANLEKEISELPSEERRDFLKELNIVEPASNILVKESYKLLGFISFFTVGEDEVRAWTIKKGMTAKEAGGRIHSDIEKGFIRAEVISYKDFIEAGSLKSAKEKGLLRLEGKTYIVEDGDIMNFRFNV
ncbi:MAG: redox-regulated ATPase YchF [Proteobacteria bacterium]|nr:redox-regulated ATPase YchF [Pseudomonadota bacterium]